MKETGVPCIIVEEHHEVLAVWHEFRKRNLFDESTVLLHVDAHSDLETPQPKQAVPFAQAEKQEVLCYVYENCSIDNFLLLALSEKYFTKLHWLSQDLGDNKVKEQRFVGASAVHPLDFISGRAGKKMQELAGSSYVSFAFTADHDLGLCSQKENIVLDIDLDYFACRARPSPKHTRIYVPENAYEELKENPLHPLRLAFGSSFSVGKDTGGCFMSVYEREQLVEESISATYVREQVSNFKELLASHHIAPRCVSVAKSNLSGYTMNAACVEEHLLQALVELYSVQPIHVKDL
jgi:hypothetical protein